MARLSKEQKRVCVLVDEVYEIVKEDPDANRFFSSTNLLEASRRLGEAARIIMKKKSNG